MIMENPARQKEKPLKGIKITDLARLAGVSKSTVHHYLNLGLLHPPQKLGLNLSVYDGSHLTKLKQIRELREKQNLPLNRIQEILVEGNHQSASGLIEEEAEALIRELEEKKKITRDRKSEKKRIEVLDAAITIFSKNGYEKTTIEAIADALHMAKSTVYLYFESKEDLFMESIDRLTVVAVPEEAWDEIRQEQNAVKKLKKRGLAFHRAFPSYKGILTMTRTALGDENQVLVNKAKNTLSLMTRPIAQDIRKGMADGLFRNIDEELVGHFILAMGEGLGCRLMMDSRYTIEEGVDIMFDLLQHGLLKNAPVGRSDSDQGPRSGDVVDIKGVRTSIRNIRFENKSHLPVKVGEAQVKISPETVSSINFYYKNSSFLAEITTKEGEYVLTETNDSLTLSGEMSIGSFHLKLSDVDSVTFHN